MCDCWVKWVEMGEEDWVNVELEVSEFNQECRQYWRISCPPISSNTHFNCIFSICLDQVLKRR